MLMDLQQMRYFLTVAETGNITKAAQLLHMAQPPLSRQIKQIETELNTQLFDRSGRQLHLTAAGTLLLHRVQEILNLTTRSLEEVKNFNDDIGGTLILGAVSTVSHTMLPEIIKDFIKLYPNIKIELIIEETTKLTELLEKGVLELGLVRQPFENKYFNSYVLPSEKLTAVLNCNAFPIDEGKTTVTISELAHYPLLLHHKYQQLLTASFKKHQCQPYYFCQSNDTLPLLSWANAGLGVVIIPENSSHLLNSAHLKQLHILDDELITTTTIIWTKKHYHSALINKFLQFVIDYLEAKKESS